jgi:hypothetical protein
MSSVFGGGGKTVNTVQNADPWSGVQPYLGDLFGQAQGLANRTPFGYKPRPIRNRPKTSPHREP